MLEQNDWTMCIQLQTVNGIISNDFYFNIIIFYFADNVIMSSILPHDCCLVIRIASIMMTYVTI